LRILVTGSRDWEDLPTLYRAIEEACRGISYHKVTIVHGHCPTGADRLAQIWAEEREEDGITVEHHPARWTVHGKAAGILRNIEMVDAGADICLAFIKNNSRGATHCANYAESKGIPVKKFYAF
jgi:hypothetical protein